MTWPTGTPGTWEAARDKCPLLAVAFAVGPSPLHPGYDRARGEHGRSDSMKRLATVITTVVGVIAISWAISRALGLEAINPFELDDLQSAQLQTAYLQAFGSVAAIVVAVWLAYWSEKTRRKERADDLRKRLRFVTRSLIGDVTLIGEEALAKSGKLSDFLEGKPEMLKKEFDNFCFELNLWTARRGSNFSDEIHELPEEPLNALLDLKAMCDRYESMYARLTANDAKPSEVLSESGAIMATLLDEIAQKTWTVTYQLKRTQDR